MIEFADPGLDYWAWWPLLLAALLALVGLVWGIVVEEELLAGPSFMALAPLLLLFFALPHGFYDSGIRSLKSEAITELGYTDLNWESGDRFTANDNGEFFSGLLLDLAPQEGYAYRIVNLNNEGE